MQIAKPVSNSTFWLFVILTVWNPGPSEAHLSSVSYDEDFSINSIISFSVTIFLCKFGMKIHPTHVRLPTQIRGW